MANLALLPNASGFEANANTAFLFTGHCFHNKALWGISVLLQLIVFPLWGETNKQVYSFGEPDNCRLPTTILEKYFYQEC